VLSRCFHGGFTVGSWGGLRTGGKFGRVARCRVCVEGTDIRGQGAQAGSAVRGCEGPANERRQGKGLQRAEPCLAPFLTSLPPTRLLSPPPPPHTHPHTKRRRPPALHRSQALPYSLGGQALGCRAPRMTSGAVKPARRWWAGWTPCLSLLSRGGGGCAGCELPAWPAACAKVAHTGSALPAGSCQAGGAWGMPGAAQRWVTAPPPPHPPPHTHAPSQHTHTQNLHTNARASGPGAALPIAPPAASWRPPGVPHTVCMMSMPSAAPRSLRANPKSASLMWVMSPGSTSSRFLSFTSRCTTPLHEAGGGGSVRVGRVGGWVGAHRSRGSPENSEALDSHSATRAGWRASWMGGTGRAEGVPMAHCSSRPHLECRYCIASMSWRKMVRAAASL
jgi:hypothetical protein